MWWAVAGALVLGAAPEERPHLIASVHAAPFTSFPDLLGAQVTLHAIPWVDLQAGLGGFTDRFTWWARGGVRYLFQDWRDEAHRGLTWRWAALAGYRSVKDPRLSAAGFSAQLATDLDWFFAAHAALSVQLGLGGVWVPQSAAFVPELRLGVGVSF